MTAASVPGIAEAVLARANRYVAIETPSGDEARMRVLAGLIAEDLEWAGADVRTVDAPGFGPHILAQRPGDDRRPLLLLGHYDTVHPVGTLERLPSRIDGARAYGPGIFDMKASIAVLVEALHGATRARPVIVLCTCDEEIGSGTSRALIEQTARECDAVLVLEPPLPDGAAKTARKGVGMFRLDAHGRPAHAGIEPERGVDAIREIAHQIGCIHELADPARGTTVTVGRVAGGSASNVVAEHATAEIDVRFVTPDEGDRVEAGLRALQPRDARVRLELGGGLNRPPLVRTPEIESLYRFARAEAAAIGFELGEGSTGGGSDGCFTAAIGVPTLDGLGVPGAAAHTLEEHVLVEALPQRVALLRRLIERF